MVRLISLTRADFGGGHCTRAGAGTGGNLGVGLIRMVEVSRVVVKVSTFVVARKNWW